MDKHTQFISLLIKLTKLYQRPAKDFYTHQVSLIINLRLGHIDFRNSIRVATKERLLTGLYVHYRQLVSQRKDNVLLVWMYM